MAQARRSGASSDGALRRKDGASRLEARRSRRDGSDAAAPGDTGPPPPGSPGTGKPEEPFRGESHGYRKTSKIGGANRAIQDRRRPTITKVSGRPIRGDVGQFRGNGMTCRKRREMTAPNDVSDNGYCIGNGARIRIASAGSGLRRSCGPEDPKGS